MSAAALPNRDGAALSLRDSIEDYAVIIFGLLSRSPKIEAAAGGALAGRTSLASHTAGRILDP